MPGVSLSFPFNQIVVSSGKDIPPLEDKAFKSLEPKVIEPGCPSLHHTYLNAHPLLTVCPGRSRTDIEECIREGTLPLWKSSVMFVLCRPGIMVDMLPMTWALSFS